MVRVKTETWTLPGRLTLQEFSDLFAGILTRVRVQRLEVKGTQVTVEMEVRDGDAEPALYAEPLLAPYDYVTRTEMTVLPPQPSLLRAAAASLVEVDAQQRVPYTWVLNREDLGGKEPPPRLLGMRVVTDSRCAPGAVFLLCGIDEGAGFAASTHHIICRIHNPSASAPPHPGLLPEPPPEEQGTP